MGMSTLEIGKMTKLKDLASIFMLMGLGMKENGKKTSNMAEG